MKKIKDAFGLREIQPNYRLLAKAANERMRQLEKEGVNAPAYKQVQGALEMIGGKLTKDGKYRFSETGKFRGTAAEQRVQIKALEKYMASETSSLRGFHRFQAQVYRTANEKYGLKERGIGKSEYFEMWEKLGDSAKDRFFYADVYITIVEAAKSKGDRRSVSSIIDSIGTASSLKEAVQNVGLTMKDYNTIKG